MSPDACQRCDRDPALGRAYRLGGRYCHGGQTPTCYELQAQEEHEAALKKFLGEE